MLFVYPSQLQLSPFCPPLPEAQRKIEPRPLRPWKEKRIGGYAGQVEVVRGKCQKTTGLSGGQWCILYVFHIDMQCQCGGSLVGSSPFDRWVVGANPALSAT